MGQGVARGTLSQRVVAGGQVVEETVRAQPRPQPQGLVDEVRRRCPRSLQQGQGAPLEQTAPRVARLRGDRLPDQVVAEGVRRRDRGPPGLPQEGPRQHLLQGRQRLLLRQVRHRALPLEGALRTQHRRGQQERPGRRRERGEQGPDARVHARRQDAREVEGLHVIRCCGSVPQAAAIVHGPQLLISAGVLAGRPSSMGTIGTDFDADMSNVIAMLGGVTCSGSTPNGVRTCSGVR